jgi:signal transduction histidine kinase
MLLPSNLHRPHALLWVPVLAIVAAGLISSAYVFIQVDQNGRAHIIDRVNTLAQAIPVADVEALQGSSTDVNRPAYQELKQLMLHERAVNRDIRFIYLIGQVPTGNLFFYGDSEDPSSPDYSPPGQDYPEATPAMHAFFKDGKSLAEGPDRDRWGLWISAYAPVRDKDGHLIAMLGMDVPAAHYLEDLAAYASLPLLLMALFLALLTAYGTRRAQQEDMLAQKAEFLSIASHQIRTPLIGIRWAVEQVLHSNDSKIGDRDRDILSLTHDSSLSLIGRVNNLLDVTALEQRNGKALHTGPVLVRPLLEEIASSLSLSAQRKKASIIIDDSVVPDLELTTDHDMLHHIFFNLIGNAVKYTRPDTTITIGYGWTPNGHQFSVTDHGLGIAQKDQELIFAGYHRTQQAVASGEAGSGLGLYLTKKLIELQKGTIEVASVPGEGSVFTITFPN